MANSRSELPLRGAPMNRDDEAISNDSPREREQCLARGKNVIARHGVPKQSRKGQPEMRQAEKSGLLRI